jgi:hypothetical protein
LKRFVLLLKILDSFETIRFDYILVLIFVKFWTFLFFFFFFRFCDLLDSSLASYVSDVVQVHSQGASCVGDSHSLGGDCVSPFGWMVAGDSLFDVSLLFPLAKTLVSGTVRVHFDVDVLDSRSHQSDRASFHQHSCPS